jgi:hypothetical protein
MVVIVAYVVAEHVFRLSLFLEFNGVMSIRLAGFSRAQPRYCPEALPLPPVVQIFYDRVRRTRLAPVRVHQQRKEREEKKQIVQSV